MVEEKSIVNRKSIKKNYFYNLAYQIFLLITPLITAPYISRVLLVDGVGEYTFSFSIVTIFTIFASLGFGYYAQREIAKHQDDKTKQSIVFWEIILCRLVPVFVTLLVNVIACSFELYGDYNVLMWILNINIFSVALDVNFLFQGNELFKSIIIRNFIIKVLTIVFIFVFVRRKEDVWVYTLINSISVLLSALSMWLPIKKLILKVNLSVLKPFRHLFKSFILFLPTIAVSVYTILDKTLLGLLVNGTFVDGVDSNGAEIIKKWSDVEVGYYEQADKIVKTALAVVTSIGIVMIPRNSNEYALGNYDSLKNNIYKTARFVFLIGIPMFFGLIGISDIFVPLFFGTEFEKSSLLIKILSPLIIIIGLSNVFGLQFLIPTGRDKEFMVALLIGAAINACLNILFIIFWWSVGASIATIVAETVVTITMAVMIRKDISLLKIICSCWKPTLSGIIMFVPVILMANYMQPSILTVFIIVLTGICVYSLSLVLLREEIIFDFFKKKNGLSKE